MVALVPAAASAFCSERRAASCQLACSICFNELPTGLLDLFQLQCKPVDAERSSATTRVVLEIIGVPFQSLDSLKAQPVAGRVGTCRGGDDARAIRFILNSFPCGCGPKGVLASRRRNECHLRSASPESRSETARKNRGGFRDL